MTAPTYQEVAAGIKGLPSDAKAKLLKHMPEGIDPKAPSTWTDQQRQQLSNAIDRLTGFDTNSDQRVLEQYRARLGNLLAAAWGEYDEDSRRLIFSALLTFGKLDEGTLLSDHEQMATAIRLIERVQAGELKPVVVEEEPERWEFIHAGAGSKLEQRRAATQLGETPKKGWEVLVTVKHPTGAVHPMVHVSGKTAETIGKLVMKGSGS